MTEPEVVRTVHRFLGRETLLSRGVSRLYTDAHHTLLPYADLRPFQRFTLDVGDFAAHPDLVGQLDDGETLFAVEAKGEFDLLKGLAQADLYQNGFHCTFLAADAGVLGSSLLSLARDKNVGVLAVSDTVEVAYTPRRRAPWHDPFQSILRQFESTVYVTESGTFQYNLPTHYLAWALALPRHAATPLDDARERLRGYPMPKGWRAALRGAEKLGIVSTIGAGVQLTAAGTAVRDVIDASVAEWAEVHRTISARGSSDTLATRLPRAAAVLRLLLLQDPMVRLLMEGLSQYPDGRTTFAKLAHTCSALDRQRALVFFFNPKAAEAITDERGRVVWRDVQPEHFRSTMFYQYKSIMKHAGLIEATRLGGSTAMGYKPERDVWVLR